MSSAMLRVLLGCVIIPASLSVGEAQPVIATPPTNEIVFSGGTAILTLEVTGPGPFTYQWRFNGTDIPNSVIASVAGNGTTTFSGDGGAATNAGLSPFGVAMDKAGAMYISDSGNSRIRKVGVNGVITTIAGTNVSGFSGDGGASTNSKVHVPTGMAIDDNGNLFFADEANSRIRRIDTNGIITTVAGGGFTSPGNGNAATNVSLSSPVGVCVDSAGDVFCTDGNRVRKIDTNGIITTVAGGGSIGQLGDGGLATNATLSSPFGVAVDDFGNLYIADNGNNRVRRVDTGGIITTIAGTNRAGFSGAGFSGDGGPATNSLLNSPYSVAADHYGYLYIADYNNNRIRQIDPAGIITTVAGNGTGNFSNDGGSPTNASVDFPSSVFIGPGHDLFVADNLFDYRIRKIAMGWNPILKLVGVTTNNAGSYDVIVTEASGNSITSDVVSVSVVFPASIQVQPTDVFVTNGSPAIFTVGASGDGVLSYQWYRYPAAVLSDETNASLAFASATSAQAGNYFCVITNVYGSVTSRIATLTVAMPPSILLQPTNQVVAIGASAVLNVTPSGTGPFTYRWMLNGTNLPHFNGANASFSPGTISTVAGTGASGFNGDNLAATNATVNNPNGVTADAQGNIYIADRSNNRIRKVSLNGIMTTVAGNGVAGTSGDGGMATNANLNGPTGVAVDGSGNLYIADTANNRVRRVDPSGIITAFAGTGVSGITGDGGIATNARFAAPIGIAIDAAGNVLIVDSNNGRIRSVDTNGIVTTLAGNTNGYSGDGGPAINATLFTPRGIAIDAAGNRFISDSLNSRVRRVDLSGLITTPAGNGSFSFSGDGGPASAATVNQPYGILADAYGEIFFSDQNNSRVRLIAANGTISTVAGNGGTIFSGDGGMATNSAVSNPRGLSFDNLGNLLIADANNRIRKVDLWRSPLLTFPASTFNSAGNYQVIITSPYGSVTSSVVSLTVVGITAQPASAIIPAGNPANFVFGVSGANALNFRWYFNSLPLAGATNATLSIASVTAGDVGNYFCIAGNGSLNITSRVATLAIGLPPQLTLQSTNQLVIGGSNTTFNVSITGTGPFTYQWQLNGTNLPNNIISTLAGGGSSFGDGGPATNATLSGPNAAVADPSGNVFVVDKNNQRIRKIDTNGVITTFAGIGVLGFSGDGGKATNAFLNQPLDVALDSQGNVYIADSLNQRIRKVGPDGVITTVAGSGSTGGGSGGFTGDGGPATNALLNGPAGVFVDAVGNLFIADRFNHRIRKVDPNGIITTVAGSGPGSGQFGGAFGGDGGLAISAYLNGPDAVVEDNFGRLIISDRDNNRVRMVDTNGIITTIAGDGGPFYSGAGGQATNASFSAVGGVTVAAGNIYFSGSSINRILQVDANGILSAIGGNGSSGYSGDGGVATNAMINAPQRIFADGAGNLLFGDQSNNRIRKIALGGSPTLTINNSGLTNAGTYQVVISNPYGSVTSAPVSLVVVLKPQNFRAAFDGSAIQLNFNGTPNYPYMLQTTTNLTPPVVWQTVMTNTADANGNWSFTDTNVDEAPQQFYRAGP